MYLRVGVSDAGGGRVRAHIVLTLASCGDIGAALPTTVREFGSTLSTVTDSVKPMKYSMLFSNSVLRAGREAESGASRLRESAPPYLLSVEGNVVGRVVERVGLGREEQEQQQGERAHRGRHRAMRRRRQVRLGEVACRRPACVPSCRPRRATQR